MNEANRTPAEAVNGVEESPHELREESHDLMERMIDVNAKAEAYGMAQFEIDKLIQKLEAAKRQFQAKQQELTGEADQIHNTLVAANGENYLQNMPGAPKAFSKAMSDARGLAKRIVLHEAATALGFGLNEDNE